MLRRLLRWVYDPLRNAAHRPDDATVSMEASETDPYEDPTRHACEDDMCCDPDRLDWYDKWFDSLPAN